MSATIIKNTAYLYAAQISSKLLYILLNIFIAKYLGVKGLGQYAAVTGFSFIFFSFINSGLDKLCIREVSKNRGDTGPYLSNFIFIKFILSTAIYLFILGILSMIRSYHDVKYLIIILCSAYFLDTFVKTFNAIFIAYEKMKYVMVSIITNDAVIVTFSILFLTLGGGLFHVFICFAIGILIAFIAGVLLLTRLKINSMKLFDANHAVGLFKKALPFMINGILLSVLFRMDTILLKMIKGNFAAGIYEAPATIFKNLTVFPVYFTMSAYPVFSKIFVKEKGSLREEYKKYFMYLLLINLFILLSSLVFGKMFILSVFGDKFIESINIFYLGLLGMFFIFQNMINIYFLDSVNRPFFNTFIFGLCIIINISLNITLIPTYSYYGAIMANIISSALLFILSAYIIDKILSFEND